MAEKSAYFPQIYIKQTLHTNTHFNKLSQIKENFKVNKK